MALVLVLSFLVLISMLIVTFFLSVMSEARHSKFYADEISTRQLGDMAVNLVIGSIREATISTCGLAAASSGTLAWASQPGMIRTYGLDGSPAAYYKLYSSGTLKITNGLTGYTPDADVVSDWNDAGKAPLYTDLNRPVAVPSSSGTSLVFPIIDPRACSSDANAVEGFQYGDTDPATGNRIGGVVAPSGGASDAQRLPMPVSWIYVLQNGALTVPSGCEKGVASWDGSSGPIPSGTNPIVGRIAYWADDDSCKVNINTAAGDLPSASLTTGSSFGSFWDTPKGWLPAELALANNQPCKNEFQRYPGHPATVSLSTAFPGLNKRPDICAIAPRIGDGGSEGGEVMTIDGALGEITLDGDRLYATVDELMFAPSRGVNPVMTPSDLEKARFFLTANSRSPDLNLFGQPRVSVWPEPKTVANRTVTDRLIAFCTTVGNKPYYFTRSDPNSTSNDWNIARNQDLYKYLQTATGKKFPGFGAAKLGNATTFQEKYGDDRDQILTEIFDYIRIVNLRDPAGTPYSSSGQVVPIQITAPHSGVSTAGFGRFDTISQASIWFYASAASGTVASKMRAVLLFEPYNVAAGYSDLSQPSYEYSIPALQTSLVTKARPSVAVICAGNTMPLYFSGNSNTMACNGGYHYRPWGGVKGIANQFLQNGSSLKDIDSTVSGASVYPFISQEIDIPDPNGTFSLSGTGFQLQIVSNGQLVQKINLYFPQTSVPYPTAPADLSMLNFKTRMGYLLNGANNMWPNFILGNDSIRSLELYGKDSDAGNAQGDVRLVQANASYLANGTPRDCFAPHESYKIGNHMAHSLSTGVPQYKYNGATVGKLVFNVAAPAQPPALPSSQQVADSAGKTCVTMSNGQPGDWDTGIGVCADGPYINKTDDGTDSAGTNSGQVGVGANIPYYVNTNNFNRGAALGFPNRQIASAVQFGSLPTGVIAKNPWQTLLFRPDPNASSETDAHKGSHSPKDHLLLDLFTMPVVEPYAISEPLSTAGRVNMNDRIAPFGYITRSTALRAALKSTMVTAIRTDDVGNYKNFSNTTTSNGSGTYRYRINPDESSGTLKFFETRFSHPDLGGLFVSPTEICDIPLVPVISGVNAEGMSTFWNDYRLSGDNVRETPYAHLYPLLTTKSNTYTVHMKVQALKKVKSTRADQWVEAKDEVLGEYQGSSVIERYIDPSDPRLANGTSDPDTKSLEPLHRFRVLSSKRFTP